MKKELFLTLLITLTTLVFGLVCANEKDDIKVTLNDEVVTFDCDPVMQNERILVPIRAIAEEIKFDVNWNENTQTVTLENFNTILTLKIDERKILKAQKLKKNGISHKTDTIFLDTPAKLINNRTYIPLRAVTESFGCEVKWDGDSKTAEIIYPFTYGKIISFKDRGIEYLTKIELLLGEQNTLNSNLYNDFIISKINDCTLDELYPFDIHEGALKTITSLGFSDNISNLPNLPDISTLEDIQNFPNLKKIDIKNKNISDLTPITYIKNWDNITFWNIATTDFKPLLEINSRTIYLENDLSCVKYSYQYEFETPEDKERFKYFFEKYNEYTDTIQKVITEYIKPDMTNEEKVLIIANWIANNIQYDYGREHQNALKENIKNNYNFSEYEIYYNDFLKGILLTKYAICHDYTVLFEQFCDALDIPCIYLVGSAYGGHADGSPGSDWGSHAWNVVKFEDGKLLHVDTTWNKIYSDYQNYYDKLIYSIGKKYLEDSSNNLLIKSYNISDLKERHIWEEDISESFSKKYSSD